MSGCDNLVNLFNTLGLTGLFGIPFNNTNVTFSIQRTPIGATGPVMTNTGLASLGFTQLKPGFYDFFLNLDVLVNTSGNYLISFDHESLLDLVNQVFPGCSSITSFQSMGYYCVNDSTGATIITSPIYQVGPRVVNNPISLPVIVIGSSVNLPVAITAAIRGSLTCGIPLIGAATSLGTKVTISTNGWLVAPGVTPTVVYNNNGLVPIGLINYNTTTGSISFTAPAAPSGTIVSICLAGQCINIPIV